MLVQDLHTPLNGLKPILTPLYRIIKNQPRNLNILLNGSRPILLLQLMLLMLLLPRKSRQLPFRSQQENLNIPLNGSRPILPLLRPSRAVHINARLLISYLYIHAGTIPALSPLLYFMSTAHTFVQLSALY